jgi:hypothetical protein
VALRETADAGATGHKLQAASAKPQAVDKKGL